MFQSPSAARFFFETLKPLTTLKLCFPIAIPVPAPRGTGRIEHLEHQVSEFRRFQGFKDHPVTEYLETLKP
jgi:hypothetical protein